MAAESAAGSVFRTAADVSPRSVPQPPWDHASHVQTSGLVVSLLLMPQQIQSGIVVSGGRTALVPANICSYLLGAALE